MGKQTPTWRETLQKSASGATDTQTSDLVPSSQEWYVSHVSLKTNSVGGATADVFITSGGTPVHVTHIALAAADTWYNAKLEEWLRESEQIRVDWSGIAASDVLELHITGIKRLITTRELTVVQS